MIRKNFLTILTSALLGTSSFLAAAGTTGGDVLPSQRYQTQGSTSPTVGTVPAQGNPGEKKSSSTTPKPPPRVKTTPPKPPEKGQTLYTSPGVIAIREGNWVGSDNLYNLSGRIGISIEILKPATLVLTVTDEALKNMVAEAFRRADLTPVLDPEKSDTPLPFFHMLVMLYPHEGILSIFTEGRLFENVRLDRVVTDTGTLLQAITWEKQSLVIVPAFDASAQVGKAIGAMVDSFTERYKYFERVKSQQQK